MANRLMDAGSHLTIFESGSSLAGDWSALWPSASHVEDVERRLQAHAEVESASVVRGIYRAAGKTLGIIGRIERKPRRLYRIGYLRMPAVVKSSLEVPKGGLGVGGEAWGASEMEDLSGHLTARLDVDRVVFYKVPTTFLEMEPAEVSPRRWAALDLLERMPTFEMGLGPTLQASVAHLGKKRRYGFRRQLDRLLALDEVAIDCFDQPHEANQFLAAAIPISEAAYQSKIATTIANSSARRNQVVRSFQSGRSVCALLRIGPRAVAFQVGSVLADTYRLEELGYLQEYSEYSPGASLLYASLDFMIDRGLARLDFGEGESQYKRVLSTEEGEVVTCVFHRKSWRALLARGIGQSSIRMDALVRSRISGSAWNKIRRLVRRGVAG